MEYLLKAGLLMTLLPFILIKVLSWCEAEVSMSFKRTTAGVLLAGILVLATWLTVYIITF